MPYNYTLERAHVFTEDGQAMFLRIRDNAHRLLREAGAVRSNEIMHGLDGDSWKMLACIDRMVELGELREVTGQTEVWAEYRVFVAAY